MWAEDEPSGVMNERCVRISDGELKDAWESNVHHIVCKKNATFVGPTAAVMTTVRALGPHGHESPSKNADSKSIAKYMYVSDRMHVN